jgi:hypothetical protein
LDHLTAEEQFKFANYCLKAGRHCTEWSLFEVSYQYYSMGMKMLDYLANDKNGGSRNDENKKWTTSMEMYDLSIDLYLSAASSCAYLGDFEAAEKYYDDVIHHVKTSSTSKENSTKSTVEKAKANAIHIQCLVMQKKYIDAINLGMTTLKSLGESNLHNSAAAGVGSAESLSQTNESDVKSAKKLLDNLLKNSCSPSSGGNTNMRMVATSIVSRMNSLDDPKIIEAMKIYYLLLAPALMAQGSLISSIAYRMVKGTLTTKGTCPVSSVGFVAMSSCFYSTGDNERGSLCERIGNEISSRYHDKACRGRILVLQNALSLPHQGFSDQLKVSIKRYMAKC